MYPSRTQTDSAPEKESAPSVFSPPSVCVIPEGTPLPFASLISFPAVFCGFWEHVFPVFLKLPAGKKNAHRFRLRHDFPNDGIFLPRKAGKGIKIDVRAVKKAALFQPRRKASSSGRAGRARPPSSRRSRKRKSWQDPEVFSKARLRFLSPRARGPPARFFSLFISSINRISLFKNSGPFQSFPVGLKRFFDPRRGEAHRKYPPAVVEIPVGKPRRLRKTVSRRGCGR